MPFYEYRCTNCQDGIELLQKINDPAPGACPHCKKGEYQRIPSLTAFHLQGGGWYKDGYSSRSSTSTASNSSDTPPQSTDKTTQSNEKTTQSNEKTTQSKEKTTKNTADKSE